MDRLEAMALLDAVVAHGSFSAASRRLGVPLPTLSRKIAELEEHLRTRLLVRSTRHLSVTEAGAAYLAAAKRILEQVEEVERSTRGEWQALRGELIITAPIVFGRLHVLPLVTEFLSLHAGIDVRLKLSDRNLGLLEDHVDLAVRIGALADSTLRTVAVGHVRRIVVAAPSALARDGMPRHPDALRDLACIVYAGLSEARSWTFMDPNSSKPFSVPVRPRLIVDTVEAGLDAAMAGLGFAQVLSYQSAAAESVGALRSVLDAFSGPPLPVSLLHVGHDRQPQKARAFLHFAAERLRERLTALERQTAGNIPAGSPPPDSRRKRVRSGKGGAPNAP